MAKYPPYLQSLISAFRKLPSVGQRTAERFAFQILSWHPSELNHLSHILSGLKEKIKRCPTCHTLQEKQECTYCDLSQRDTSILCVISSFRDVFAIEETRSFHGLYHVLDGLLSPLEGIHPHHLNLTTLFDRLKIHAPKEIILAFDTTLEGDATSLYLKDKLQSLGIPLTRLALGIPMGSSLDFIDDATLKRSLMHRVLL